MLQIKTSPSWGLVRTYTLVTEGFRKSPWQADITWCTIHVLTFISLRSLRSLDCHFDKTDFTLPTNVLLECELIPDSIYNVDKQFVVTTVAYKRLYRKLGCSTMRCPVIDIRHLVLRNAFLITYELNILKQTTANISTGHVQTQSRFSSLFCVLFFPLLVARSARRHCEITANVTQECVYTALLYCCETDSVT